MVKSGLAVSVPASGVMGCASPTPQHPPSTTQVPASSAAAADGATRMAEPRDGGNASGGGNGVIRIAATQRLDRIE